MDSLLICSMREIYQELFIYLHACIFICSVHAGGGGGGGGGLIFTLFFLKINFIKILMF